MATSKRRSNFFRTIASIPADCRGASAVEFAFVAPVLFFVMFAIFSIAMVLRAHTSISTYAREAARGLAIGYMTELQAKQFAETHSAAELGIAVTTVIDPATKGNVNDRDVVVTVAISERELGKLAPFGGWVRGGIQTKVVMRSLDE